MTKRLVVACLVTVAAGAPAQAPRPLAGIDFLLGRWTAGRGTVAETGGTSTGSSTFTREAGGQAMLRRDHTDLTDASGKPAGGFDQIMLIYADGPTIRADYADGAHVIHYAGATITPGRAVEFATAAGAPGPAFRLRYELTAPMTLSVAFAMAPPGGGAFRPIATGTLTRAP
jgi:hypothetical protein